MPKSKTPAPAAVSVIEPPAEPAGEPPFDPSAARAAVDRDVAQLRDRLASIAQQHAGDPSTDVDLASLGHDIAGRLLELANLADDLGTTPKEG